MTDHDQRKRRCDANWMALQQLNETARFADLKATAVLAAAGLFGSQLWTATSELLRPPPAQMVALTVIAGVAAAASALLALSTLAPRHQAAAPEPLHHFDHVAKRYGRNSQGFIDAWLTTTADESLTARMLAGHIWAAHLVAHQKFVQVTWSIRLLVLGILVWLTASFL
ncbi:Pycsar system effector family protein [Micromonosporaceae bacterium DT194]|uniref:Pycsar system effector family protein n=1 Tax=Melissospora conviva TaxID=3388432 RepID=UPI003C275B04